MAISRTATPASAARLTSQSPACSRTLRAAACSTTRSWCGHRPPKSLTCNGVVVVDAHPTLGCASRIPVPLSPTFGCQLLHPLLQPLDAVQQVRELAENRVHAPRVGSGHGGGADQRRL